MSAATHAAAVAAAIKPVKFPKRFPSVGELSLLLRPEAVRNDNERRARSASGGKVLLDRIVGDRRSSTRAGAAPLPVTPAATALHQESYVNEPSLYFASAVNPTGEGADAAAEGDDLTDIPGLSARRTTFTESELQTVHDLAVIAGRDPTREFGFAPAVKPEFKAGIPLGKDRSLDSFRRSKKVLDNMKTMNQKVADYKTLLKKKKIAAE